MVAEPEIRVEPTSGVAATERPWAKKRFVKILQDTAARAVAEEDPWAGRSLEVIPAERVIRHLYRPDTHTWTTDETIVKCEREAFAHGAMRWCYRLKKRSPPPESASNHRFHGYGWTRASNYVAKAYHVDGVVDTSEAAKEAVRNDIRLQYEAQHWATRFNHKDPPKKIVFLRAYAMEFPNREGSPWFAVERFISGKDSYGCGFTKHNTNAGFVDDNLRRVTPQVFSACSFYESEGNALVADVQGVGDLYTDPQVLSSDYRFGEGDLGPRGMALFFKTFRHNTLADSLGIPVFALSRNELKHQEIDEDGDSMLARNPSFNETVKSMDKFAVMDEIRTLRRSVLTTMPKQRLPDEEHNPEIRSNYQEDIRTSLVKSRQAIPKTVFTQDSTEMEEVRRSLTLARQDSIFGSSSAFDRKEYVATVSDGSSGSLRSSVSIRSVSEPMSISAECKFNLGKVHYQLAVLHGMGRFAEERGDTSEPVDHDVSSVLFHLAHASAFNCVAACLALGRLYAGMSTSVSPLLDDFVPVDFDIAKDLLRRALESPYPPMVPKAAAGCLLYQIYVNEKENHVDDEDDEKKTADMPSDAALMDLLQYILQLMHDSEREQEELEAHNTRLVSCKMAAVGFQAGDRVLGNYLLEGVFYPGVIESVSDDGREIVLIYDDDESMETLSKENVRPRVPLTATQTALGGPMSDGEALGTENSDEKWLIEVYQLQADLAALKEKSGYRVYASVLYEDASNGAMAANLMKQASDWSLKSSELSS